MSNSNSEYGSEYGSSDEASVDEASPEMSGQSVSGQSEDGQSEDGSEPDAPAPGGAATRRKFYYGQAMECDGPSKGTYLHNPLHNVLSSMEYMPCLLASIA